MRNGLGHMNGRVGKLARCAIYTRKSSEHNLHLAFTSLDAQREACEAYIKSQAHEGWRLIPGRYHDGALSGASLERPALQQLLADVRAGTIDIVLVYKVDRLTRSLADFAKLVELFDAHGVSFVSVTQQFRTALAQLVAGIVVHSDRLVVRLKSDHTDEASDRPDNQSLTIPWRKPPSK